MSLRANELETLFTANLDQLEKADKRVKEIADRVEKKPIEQKVTADITGAVDGMDRVEAQAKALVSRETAMSLDIKVANAENNLDRTKKRLDLLKIEADAGIDVKAQLGRAEAEVSKMERNLEKLRTAQTTIEIEAPADDALKSMDRVEDRAKRLVSQAIVTRIEAETERAEQNVDKLVANLEVLRALEPTPRVNVDIAYAEKRLVTARARLDDLQGARATMQVEAEEKPALDAIERVARAGKELVSRATAVRINAEVDKASADIDRIEGDLEVLRELRVTPEVTADIDRAEAQLRVAKDRLEDLDAARAEMVVDVSDNLAKQKLADVADYAEETGDDGGNRSGVALGAGIIAGLATIPVVGAIAAIGKAGADALVGAINDGLAQDRNVDRLGALTGLDDAAALRIARSAGEAYANVFGESIEANMDTARLALQFDLVDPKASVRASQQVVQGLAGIADVLEEDVRPVATAVTTLLKSGMAANAQEAFDILAAGQREGVNRGEDLLDTFTEYPVVLKRLGITGGEMLGLINQGLDAGARNSDVAADALKEFQIRATDGAESSIKGFQRLGLNGERMTAKIARGGQDARDGLQEVLTKLREMEDPVARNAAAVELFGTKAEDMGEALFALDLTTAVDQLDGVTGAAQRMFDRIADNDATKMEQAQRNIEVATDGIKGALATAFSEPLGEAAEFVSENRGPVLQFLLELSNGAIDFGVSLVEGLASGTEAFGEFIAGPGASFIDTLNGIHRSMNWGQDNEELVELRDEMRGFDDDTAAAADTMRQKLITEGLEPARDRLNEFGEGVVSLGYLNDASLRLAETLGQVGYTAEGAAISMDGVDLANLHASESGKLLEDQVRNTLAALSEEVSAAAAAGEGQDDLKGRYDATTGALEGQLVQMGLTQEQARALIDTILQTPAQAYTGYGSNATAEQGKVQSLADRITTLPDGTVVISADTTQASSDVESFISRYTGNTISLRVDGTPVINGVPQVGRAHGGAVYGQGTETSDSIDARLSHNEHVWTAAEARGAGGHAKVEKLRAYAKAGRLGDLLPGFRDGGPVLERYIGAPPAAIANGSTALAVASNAGGGLPNSIAAAIVSALGTSAGGSAPARVAALVEHMTFVASGNTEADLRALRAMRDELRILQLGGRGNSRGR